MIVGVLLACSFPPSLQAGPVAAPMPPPILGVDMAGSFHLGPGTPLVERTAYWTHAPYHAALDDLGASHVVVHLFPEVNAGDANSSVTMAKIAAIESGMRARGRTFELNLEDANYRVSAEIDPGVNEYTRPGGVHRWDLRMEWLDPILPPALPDTSFRGVTLDEIEHMQLTGTQFANQPAPPFDPPNSFDAPGIADVRGLSPEQSFDRLVEACVALRTGHYAGRVPLRTEQIWPDMFPVFARAGMSVAPKLLMDELSAVSISIGLGAAIQYADRVPEFWTLLDMHRYVHEFRFPGHSLEAMRSALLLGYWLGVDGLYVENLDFDGDATHPDADGDGGLLRWADDDHCTVTAHGRVVREFYRDYAPANPRPAHWREYRPRVAIVRLPDGDVGQPGAFFRRRLLGNPEAPPDAISAEWLHVWPILTHGAARAGSITKLALDLYPTNPEPDFFVPIDSVAVFDHHVTGPVLDSVECFVVCGHALSPETFAAIAARVEAGATCVIARRLFDLRAPAPFPAPPPGAWVVVEDFAAPEVATALAPFLGEPDVARFRFARHVVEFRRGAATDSTTVRVIATDPATVTEALLGERGPLAGDDATASGAVDVGDAIRAGSRRR